MRKNSFARIYIYIGKPFWAIFARTIASSCGGANASAMSYPNDRSCLVYIYIYTIALPLLQKVAITKHATKTQNTNIHMEEHVTLRRKKKTKCKRKGAEVKYATSWFISESILGSTPKWRTHQVNWTWVWARTLVSI